MNFRQFVESVRVQGQEYPGLAYVWDTGLEFFKSKNY